MFQPSHGYERMIRSIHKYKQSVESDRQKEIVFYLVGDGALRGEWESLVDELALNDTVILTGVKTGSELSDVVVNYRLFYKF
jgi:glycosyltransferase involved in cell wall biosynthesis